MEKKIVTTGVTSVLAVLLSVPIAWGETAGSGSSNTATAPNGPQVNTKTQEITTSDQISAAAAALPRQQGIRVSEILDKEVKNKQGEKLGEIDELVMDTSGNARYAILSHGGILNIGDKLIAIPWSALQNSPEGDYLILNISKDRLAQAPTFSKNQWPSIADTKWNQSVHSYYGSPYVPSTQPDFAQLDANADGFITKQEAQAKSKLSAGFTKMDKNKDGKLDPGEFSAFETSPIATGAEEGHQGGATTNSSSSTTSGTNAK